MEVEKLSNVKEMVRFHWEPFRDFVKDIGIVAFMAIGVIRLLFGKDAGRKALRYFSNGHPNQ